jgi:hypothetical protein
MTLFTRSPHSTALIGDARLYGGHFLESNGIVNGNSRRSETNPENDQPFPELGLSSVREFPGSIQCIPDIWLRRVYVVRKRAKAYFIEQGYWHGPSYAFAHPTSDRQVMWFDRNPLSFRGACLQITAEAKAEALEHPARDRVRIFSR